MINGKKSDENVDYLLGELKTYQQTQIDGIKLVHGLLQSKKPKLRTIQSSLFLDLTPAVKTGGANIHTLTYTGRIH